MNNVYFIWKVSGSYLSYDARSARKSLKMGSLSDIHDMKKNYRTEFSRMIGTRDPMAEDLIRLATRSIIGDVTQAALYEEWEVIINGLEFIGECLIEREE